MHRERSLASDRTSSSPVGSGARRAAYGAGIQTYLAPRIASSVSRSIRAIGEWVIAPGVAAQIPCDQPKASERGARHLPLPRQGALRKAVDEEDLRSRRVARFVDREGDTIRRRQRRAVHQCDLSSSP